MESQEPKQSTIRLETAPTTAALNYYQNFNLTSYKVDTLAITGVGTFGFCFACFSSACLYCKLISLESSIIAVLLIPAGLFQFIAGLFDMYRGNSLGGFLSITFGIYNSEFLFFNMFPKIDLCPAPDGPSQGWFNMLLALFNVGVLISSLKGPVIGIINNFFIIMNFLFQGILFFSNKEEIGYVVGISLFIVCIITSYMVLSGLMKEVYKEHYLPLGVKGEESYWSKKKKNQ